MNVSLGIMAYNEEANIGRLLAILLERNIGILNEIIVVTDGSTDKTVEIVKKYTSNPKIKLIELKERQGKVTAINEFIKIAKSEILILESADTIPKEDAYNKIIEPFKNSRIGVVASRVVPRNKAINFIEFFGKYIYSLHHEVSLENPKFGELIAFRNIIPKVPMTAVDEEAIAMIIKKKGYKGAYMPEAIVNNLQPKNIKDIIRQRRRIHAGHIALMRKGYKVPTNNPKNCLKAVIKTFQIKNTHKIILSILLETYTRILGAYDYITKGERKHYKWERVPSTKDFQNEE